MEINFDDKGYDPHAEKITDGFNKWANNLADRYACDMEHCPDTVAMFAGLQIAVRKTALLTRRNLMTKQEALQIFTNFLNEAIPQQGAQA